MEEIQLEVSLRKEKGKSKVKALRRAKLIPAVVYSDKANHVLSIDRTCFQRAIGTHPAENVIVNLKIRDEASDAKKHKEHYVIIKDIQYDPVLDTILHVDFHEISLTEEITVKVPIIAKGEPIGVKQDSGALEHQLWELEIKCLPRNMPEKIEVDVTSLNIGDNIHVKDLKLPAGVVFLQDPEMVVVSVAAPIKEEAPPEEAVEGEAAEGAQEPEVIKEKKEKGEEEGKEAPEVKEKPKEKTKE
ncbi:MAG: 50S ribosomal protein L25 [Candidatus Omnitrophica bacterium]|nr:50S ribosomal protein L25 [Candidatus Omnitrophota bacterium]